MAKNVVTANATKAKGLLISQICDVYQMKTVLIKVGYRLEFVMAWIVQLDSWQKKVNIVK